MDPLHRGHARRLAPDAHSVVFFAAGAPCDLIGEPLGIRLRSLGRQANVDAMSLVASPIPEPSRPALLGTGLLAVLMSRRRAARHANDTIR